ncbi:hypothetical protein KC669_00995 [Candidatus Dojkabacteria bacterium]|uniref:DUF916 domain-containing protein n=1 Tax=Candidatus Dojkabacteria bacterium TaxID=2099670 RepID=A0A955L9N2_9BACT|nr:hypothetical protein [Candidatus Dojkabacteria bacterium]
MKFINLTKLSVLAGITLSAVIFLSLAAKKTVLAARGPIIDEIMFEFEDVKPGDKITRSYTVTHDYAPLADGTDPVVSFELEVVDFMQREGDGKPIFSVDTDQKVPDQIKISDWVTLTPSSFILEEQGQTQEIIVEIDVPSDALGGGRYGSILLKPTFVDDTGDGVSTQSRPSAQAGVSTQLHTLIFLTVDGDIVVDMDIKDFHLETLDGSTKSIFWNPPVKAVVTFENKGNVHLAPRGIIFFHNGKDEIEARLNAEYTEQLNDELTYILPGSTRTYEYIWQPDSFIYQEPVEIHGDEGISLKPGDPRYDDYPVLETTYSTKFDWSNFSKIKFGKYAASIQYSADNDTDFADLESRTDSISFYFIPIQVIIPIVVILFVFGIVVFLIGWSSKRKKTMSTTVSQPIPNTPAPVQSVMPAPVQQQ